MSALPSRSGSARLLPWIASKWGGSALPWMGDTWHVCGWTCTYRAGTWCGGCGSAGGTRCACACCFWPLFAVRCGRWGWFALRLLGRFAAFFGGRIDVTCIGNFRQLRFIEERNDPELIPALACAERTNADHSNNECSNEPGKHDGNTAYEGDTYTENCCFDSRYVVY